MLEMCGRKDRLLDAPMFILYLVVQGVVVHSACRNIC